MYNYFLIKLGQFIVLSFPLKIAYSIAVLISDINYLFAKEDKQAVKENLKVIFPQKSDQEINQIRIKLFRNFAKYLTDFFRFSKMDLSYINKYVRVENRSYLDQALAKGKGVIVVSAHLGNWELGGVVVALLGYPFSAVALPHKNKQINNFFNRQRQSKNFKVIPLGKAARQCLDVLKKNEVLALAGDRDFTEKGIVLDFFGKPSFFPIGPAAFALKTGAVLMPGFMYRNDDDGLTLRFEKPLEFSPSGDKNQDLKYLIENYKNIIQDYIRKYPEQWYMFKRFWIEEKK
ncbi:MAG: lysophospholipid acyltransferase family protein [Candidatus Omnitrophota bacterium]